jgi:imidazolonepropionase-like amidohydrolase
MMIIVLMLPQVIFSQAAQDTLSKGTFILHKFQQPIGKEFYSIVKKSDSLRIHSDFKFNDRGSDVPLQTTLVTDIHGIPFYFKTKGSTSRSSVIDSEVKIKNSHALIRVNKEVCESKTSKQYFTISGYSPVVIQMQLLKYWKDHDKPGLLTTYPSGTVKIRLSGFDTIAREDAKIVLERYFISGLIWGNEIVWTDASGKLVALFTNDAEGDKFEGMEESYVSLLPMFIAKAAAYGMASFNTNQTISKSIGLKNANIINVVSGQVTRNGVVLIKNGIIQKVGQASEVKIPSGIKVIDLAGKYILPGLWDMHAHFQQVEWGPAYLAAGVTTVRDCGNEFDFINAVKEAIDNNKGIGPRIIKAGIVDGDGRFALGIVRVNNATEAKAVVKRYKDAGFEQIKIYSSVKPDIIKAIASEAHSLGLSVTGHVPQGVKTLDAIALGLNQINHFPYIYSALLSPGQKKISLKDSSAQNALRILKENHVVVDPTLGVFEWTMRSLDDPMETIEPGVNYITEDLKEIFRNTGLPGAEAAKNKFFLEGGKEIVLALHRMGIPIVAGTDMLIPGFSIYRELELYQSAGLSALEAIQTAAIVPARVMKKESESGTIEEGKNADMIIVDNNPLANISNLRQVSLVLKGGTIYNPSELRKMVGFKP